MQASLRGLFLGNSVQNQGFLDNIRQYNAAFTFPSLGVKQDYAINQGRGPYVFKIHDELCRAGALLPAPGEQPSYSQLYIHDLRAVVDLRSHQNENLCPATMQTIKAVLSDHHFYASIYSHAHEVLQQHQGVGDVTVCLHCLPGQDRRRYNLPTADEISLVLPGDGSQHCDSRDIILRLRRPDGTHCSASARVTLHILACIMSFYSLTVRRVGTGSMNIHRACIFHIASFPDPLNLCNIILRGRRLLQQHDVPWPSDI